MSLILIAEVAYSIVHCILIYRIGRLLKVSVALARRRVGTPVELEQQQVYAEYPWHPAS